MTKGITGDELHARIIYKDIIDLPHHQSPTRPHMSLHDRAAQFAPFAALTGYDDMVTEEARLTDRMTALSEAEAENCDRTLNLLLQALDEGRHPVVYIEYFIPDPFKSGGRYETVTDQIYQIDLTERTILLKQPAGRAKLHRSIEIDRIREIREEDL